MDVAFSDDQELLRKSAREFLADQSPTSVVNEIIEQGPDAPPAQRLWKQMAELGWMGLGFDESRGGLGLTHVDVAILAEEMGRVLLPVPWFSTVALAGEAIRTAGSEEQQKDWLSRIAGGELKATLAIFEAEGKPDLESISATASPEGGGYSFKGTKAFVPDLSAAEIVIVAAKLHVAGATDDKAGPGLFVVPREDLDIKSEPTLDGTRPLGTVTLDGLNVPDSALLGGRACGAETLQHILDRAATILSAEMCGGSQQMLDASVDYAKVRHQFGRPIGSFQGVSHRCSEMLLAIEAARSLTYYGAWCCDEDPGAAPLAASSAKASASDCYRSCSAQAIQIHGGIGFTWEANLHLWYRRAFWSAAFLGDAVYHRARVVQLLNL